MRCQMIIALLFTIQQLGVAQKVTENTVPVYSLNNPSSIKIPVDFGKAELKRENALSNVDFNQVTSIDLVFTNYKEEVTFQQNVLNQLRKTNLIEQYPELNRNDIQWNFIGQSQPNARSDAQKAFHGFVVHLDADMSYLSQKDFFSNKTKDFTSFQVSLNSDTVLNHESGTIIHVPENCVVYADGSPVEGGFELKYREFREPVDIALSGIPMTYQENGKSYFFRSQGMFEIRGEKNGKDLKLNAPITIDFNQTESTRGTCYYSLDDATGIWKKEHVISSDEKLTYNDLISNPNGATIRKESEVFMEEISSTREIKGTITFSGTKNDGSVNYVKTGVGRYSVKFSEAIWDVLLEEEMDGKIKLDREDGLRTVKMNKQDIRDASKLLSIDLTNIYQSDAVGVETRPLVSYSEAAQKYSKVVNGLRSKSFGVYNCDQAYRMNSPIALKANYKDAESNLLDGFVVACVIDKRINGSLSFHPSDIQISTKSESYLLLFDKDNQVFFANPEQLANLVNGKGDLVLKDITDIASDAQKLKDMLNI